MASKGGAESPPPEELPASQIGPISNGQGMNPGFDNKEQSRKDIDALPSNPKGGLEEQVEEVNKKLDTKEE